MTNAPLHLNDDGFLVNMYDCTPCPKCRGTHRYPHPHMNPVCCCDDCGLREPWIRSTGRPAEGDCTENCVQNGYPAQECPKHGDGQGLASVSEPLGPWTDADAEFTRREIAQNVSGKPPCPACRHANHDDGPVCSYCGCEAL